MPLDQEGGGDLVLSAALLRTRSAAVLLMVAANGTYTAVAAELVFDNSIEHGHVAESMRHIRVKAGDVVKLRWTTDRAVVLHLHGYDIEKPVEPGVTTEFALTTDATGRFPIYAHAQGERAEARAHRETPLIYVEVYPQ
jgi:plastocyanin